MYTKNQRTRKYFLVLFLFPFLYGQKLVESPHAMVVSARKEASAVGIQILHQGGNAFDAMVATELALAVAYPYAGNIGGGGSSFEDQREEGFCCAVVGATKAAHL